MQRCCYLIALWLLVMHLPFRVHAQGKQYALIIGIDRYEPATSFSGIRREWSNLEGCVNDAVCIRDFCLFNWKFPESQIITLLNEQASRDSILHSLEQLLTTAVKGDVIFIYYAGHGSQVKNSLSSEPDKKDETLVPADFWKKGVQDIRDKELAVYFNRLLDKGVLLTVIFDSCHSGSAARGKNDLLFGEENTRYMEEASLDVMDAITPRRPEERGALILSAAQDFEFAKEQMDENNHFHGAFTLALLKALRQLPPAAPAADIFNSLSAIMKYYGKTQEPVLAGTADRKRSPLFGSATPVSGKLLVPSGKNENQGIELMGGRAFGLGEGSRLAHGNDTLEIMALKGVNRSVARVISGLADRIQPGTLFEPVNWVNGTQPALKVYIPNSVDPKHFQEFMSTARQLKKNTGIRWVNELTTEIPGSIIYYENDHWYCRDKTNTVQKIGMLASISGSSCTQPYLLLLPPTHELAQHLHKKFSAYNNVQVTTDVRSAQYLLSGCMNRNGKAVFAFMRNRAPHPSAGGDLPARTDYWEADNPEEAASHLCESAFRIARIQDWLMLTPPAGENRFPFVLDFTYFRTGKNVGQEKVKSGDTLTIRLKEDSANGGWNPPIKKRYVYLFSIDSRGSMNLLFPAPESGNTENRFPVTTGSDKRPYNFHLADIEITPPAGADHYFMLSSEQAIQDLSVFNQEAVLTRGPIHNASGQYNLLESLLTTGSKSRGKLVTPANWSLIRRTVISHQ